MVAVAAERVLLAVVPFSLVCVDPSSSSSTPIVVIAADYLTFWPPSVWSIVVRGDAIFSSRASTPWERKKTEWPR